MQNREQWSEKFCYANAVIISEEKDDLPIFLPYIYRFELKAK